jgi:hypothetical protein
MWNSPILKAAGAETRGSACSWSRRLSRLAARATPEEKRSSRVLVRSSEDCFAPDPDIGEVTEVQFRFHSAGGQGAAALRALSEAARETPDPMGPVFFGTPWGACAAA